MYRAPIGSMLGPYVASRVSLGSEQAQDQPGSAKGPKCGLRSRFQGLEQAGSSLIPFMATDLR